MYKNLIGEIAVRKIAKTEIASKMGIDRKTLEKKLTGKSKFTISEMFFIQTIFFPDANAEELFAKNN